MQPYNGTTEWNYDTDYTNKWNSMNNFQWCCIVSTYGYVSCSNSAHTSEMNGTILNKREPDLNLLKPLSQKNSKIKKQSNTLLKLFTSVDLEGCTSPWEVLLVFIGYSLKCHESLKNYLAEAQNRRVSALTMQVYDNTVLIPLEKKQNLAKDPHNYKSCKLTVPRL